MLLDHHEMATSMPGTSEIRPLDSLAVIDYFIHDAARMSTKDRGSFVRDDRHRLGGGE
jgi:hypothetical protein